MIESKSAIFFKVLLNRFHPGNVDQLLQRLPQDQAQAIVNQKLNTDNAGVALTFEADLLERTHYSWLAPIINEMPQSIQVATIAALSKPQADKLKSFLKISAIPKHLPQSVKHFFSGRLFQKLSRKRILPRQFLPESQLSPLLSLSKAQIVNLIDLLSMHDLAESLRHIVDKTKLKTIYEYLPKKDQQYLKICLHQKERVTAPKLEIEKWGGDAKKLEMLLHSRGLLRLGKAVCGQSPQFIWHLIHIMDSGRGTIVKKHFHKEPIPTITPQLIQQLQSAMNFLNKTSAP